jgi:E3 ubiquitin-protein ligase UBR7
MTDSTAEGEKTVTAVEYLENQLALEKEAADILPGKFENCTYKLGHIRQAVYACKTCSNLDPDHPAGMCYGCSIACHADHEVLELFSKRHFRCDCGLKSKFGGAACELDMESKAGSRNDDNAYNHNFVGQYCRYVSSC